MKELNRKVQVIVIFLITLFILLSCNEDSSEEPIVSFTNPKLDSLVHDFTVYLPDSAFLYKGKKVVSVWIEQRKENDYLIIIDNNIPFECEKRVGVLYRNGFKVYVLITTDIKKQKLVHIENSYSKRSKKKCQKWLDKYIEEVESDPSSRGRRVEEAFFDFINDTLYFSATSYLYEGFKSNIPKD